MTIFSVLVTNLFKKTDWGFKYEAVGIQYKTNVPNQGQR